MTEVGCLKDGCFQNVKVEGMTILSGVRNSDTTSSAATSAAISLLHVQADHKLLTTGVLAERIELPQATAANLGMVIEVFIGTTVDDGGDAFISVKQGGTTVFIGGYTTGLLVGSSSAKEDTSIGITASAQSIVLDSNNVATAGGAAGSHYKFTYVAAGKIFVSGLGLITGTSAAAPTAAGSVTTGF